MMTIERKFIEDQKLLPEIPKTQRHPSRPSLAKYLSGFDRKSERNIRIIQAHVKHCYTLKKIADHLGIHYATVSKIVRKAGEEN